MDFPRFARICSIAALLPVFAVQGADDTPLESTPPAPEPSRVLLNADGSNDRWNGIGRIVSKKGDRKSVV